jgi:hypothetical protein
VTTLNTGRFSWVTGDQNGMWPTIIISIAKTIFF